MYLTWKKKQITSSQCVHGGATTSLRPLLCKSARVSGKVVTAFRYPLGPPIRECCLQDSVAQKIFWEGVASKISELKKKDTVLIDWEQSWPKIERLLLAVVRRPASRKTLPEFASTLGLSSWPCSLEELKRVWRALALKHHPDQGGDPDTFRNMKTAYERALKEL